MRSTRNPLDLSSLGYGSWEAGGGTTWGPNASHDEVISAVRRSIDLGMNWVDTAEVYGGGGGAETVVGEALQGLGGVRVCTKVAPEPDDERYTESGLRQALEQSLKRLGRDRIDLYLLHWPALELPLEVTWEAMSRLREEGLVGAIGLSNYPLEAVARCADLAPVDYVQVQASLLYRDELDAFGPLCLNRNIGLLAYGPLAYGLLTGAIDEDTQFADWRGGEVMAHDFFCAENHPRFFAPKARRAHLPVVRRLAPLAEQAGCSVAQLALAWLLARPEVVAAAVGTRNPVHAEANAAAAGMTLDEDLLLAVSALMEK
ncbi:aldo/keto reductase [Streptomyces sp. NEAU-Y11]|uniref:aldo/keto reductase n=1 Tax=Streptomyces cucumeris TaxID=2962890 RepID=UPI0020C909AC|nr:aldo/keto reductase [Streptomyces sp. NEAU-Y11]MCP9213338.1 aldo/keto reductase [Streptomyces sp. NEAU-Y11]